METRYLTRAAVIAALYVALTVTPPLNAIAYGPIQVRVSEALTVLAYFEPAAIPGLWLGAVISNYLGPNGLVDVVFGAGLTLVAAWLTWRIRRPVFALLPPVILNGLGVAVMLKFLLAPGLRVPGPFLALAASVTVGEAIAVYAIGYPLLMFSLKNKQLIRQDVFSRKMGD